MKRKIVFLKIRQKQLSREIKFSKNGKGKHKKSMMESKKGLWTLTEKKQL